jgi:SAM-dependent methyltransferase
VTFDPDYTATWYDRLGVGEWERWERSPVTRMQYQIYLHHLRRVVIQGDRVLDAGCGAGRFTRELVSIGADVVALDISATQLSLCQQRAPGARDYVLGSITDLARFENGSFDVVLALGGPLSYCFDRAGAALAELKRVARPGARLMLSVMNLLGAIHQALPGVLGVDAAVNERILRTGGLTREVSDGHECHLYRLEELHALLEAAGLEDIDVQAPGWLTAVHRSELPPEGSAQWRFLLNAELQASRESPAAGTHLLAFARVPTSA